MNPSLDQARDSAEQAAQALLPGVAVTMAPVHGGANNRAWRVDASGGPFLLKQYYCQPPPARDRYASEHAFYSYAESRAPKEIPHPLGWNDQLHAALFTFVPGRKLAPEEVTDARVIEALNFFGSLNKPPAKPAVPLPEAAEACFRVDDHLTVVEKRVQRLLSLPTETGDDLAHAAREFVVKALQPAWRDIEAHVRRHASALHETTLTRCVSPSDFGFHNALLQPSGRLCFFDFEYAGWDDPAKAIADFLCQPEIPAGRHRREPVTAAISALFPQDASLPERARLLFPVYQIKWCCIMLNDFLPEDRRRRDFSLSTTSTATTTARRQRQLERAQSSLPVKPFTT